MQISTHLSTKLMGGSNRAQLLSVFTNLWIVFVTEHVLRSSVFTTFLIHSNVISKYKDHNTFLRCKGYEPSTGLSTPSWLQARSCFILSSHKHKLEGDPPHGEDRAQAFSGSVEVLQPSHPLSLPVPPVIIIILVVALTVSVVLPLVFPISFISWGPVVMKFVPFLPLLHP